MTVKTLIKPAVLVALLTLAVVVAAELYLRQQGVVITYDDSPERWAHKRSRVYQPAGRATVFIGSSRIKYDLDIATWEQQTGKEAVQLAVEGNSPLPVLQDLANDAAFSGNLVVDVTELLYYSQAPDFSKETREFIRYYNDQTCAQRVGFHLGHLLESQFVFLNKKYFSLHATLESIPLENREGVKPPLHFPMDFVNYDANRQSTMNTSFQSSPEQIKQVTDIWSMVLGMITNAPPPTENPVPGILKISKEAVDKIRARGGDVVFVRTPSSGPFYAMEQKVFDKAVFWETLLTETNSKGFYFKDYPTISRFECPEWSHLSPAQAEQFTREFIRILPPSFTR